VGIFKTVLPLFLVQSLPKIDRRCSIIQPQDLLIYLKEDATKIRKHQMKEIQE